MNEWMREWIKWKATKVHVYVQCFSLSFQAWEDLLTPQHNMPKLYLVHLRPLGVHGIFIVVLSIQVPVVPSWHGTTRDIPGTSHYLTSPCQFHVWVVPSCHGTTWDILGTSHYLTPPCESQVRVVLSRHGTTWDILGTLHHPASPKFKNSNSWDINNRKCSEQVNVGRNNS